MHAQTQLSNFAGYPAVLKAEPEGLPVQGTHPASESAPQVPRYCPTVHALVKQARQAVPLRKYPSPHSQEQLLVAGLPADVKTELAGALVQAAQLESEFEPHITRYCPMAQAPAEQAGQEQSRQVPNL